MNLPINETAQIFEEILQLPPYSLDMEAKKRLYSKMLSSLTRHHAAKCPLYAQLLRNLDIDSGSDMAVDEIPFLPVRLFKDLDLMSVKKEDVVKTMTSSGTTGQSVSKIYLDKVTSMRQTKALVKITSDFLGKSRPPLLIVDTPSVLKDRNSFSARGAGVLGFSMLGRNVTYALKDDMTPDLENIRAFTEKHKEGEIFLFGFTYIIWLYLLSTLEDGELDLSNGIMLHGGGFKKLEAEAVSNEIFKEKLRLKFGLEKVYNYYGMVEQTGSIFMECEYGRLHASTFSDIFIRNPVDFSLLPNGVPGLIQLVSVLPESYPGHSILTEDTGFIIGEDDCPCGRLGKTFKVCGRIKNAEIRGCSDTYAR